MHQHSHSIPTHLHHEWHTPQAPDGVSVTLRHTQRGQHLPGCSALVASGAAPEDRQLHLEHEASCWRFKYTRYPHVLLDVPLPPCSTCSLAAPILHHHLSRRAASTESITHSTTNRGPATSRCWLTHTPDPEAVPHNLSSSHLLRVQAMLLMLKSSTPKTVSATQPTLQAIGIPVCQRPHTQPPSLPSPQTIGSPHSMAATAKYQHQNNAASGAVLHLDTILHGWGSQSRTLAPLGEGTTTHPLITRCQLL